MRYPRTLQVQRDKVRGLLLQAPEVPTTAMDVLYDKYLVAFDAKMRPCKHPFSLT